MAINSQVIAILRGIRPEEVNHHIRCLLDNDISQIEITTNSPDWQSSIQGAVKHFGPHLNIGAGTVVTSRQVDESVAAGARFILTPNLDPQLVAEAKKQGLTVYAGVFSASEIFLAAGLGVEVMKIFPACALPVNYPQLIKGPLSQPVRFSAVGGITVDNAADYLVHYDSVGIGSSLYRPGQSVAETAKRCKLLI